MSTIKIEKNSLFPTMIVMAVSAVIGGILALAVGLFATTSFAIMSGPLGWFILLPALLANFSIAVTWVLIGVPLWAIIGGYWFACNAHTDSKIALGITFFSDEHPITQKVQELANDLNIPPIPFVGFYADENINAFAMGVEQSNTLIAFTQGAVEKLTKEELDAVIAHELAHVANKDMARMTFARGVQEALTFFLIFRGLKQFARWVFSPIAELEILRLSREREFAADKIAAQLTSPADMVSVLNTLQHAESSSLHPDHDNLKVSGSITSGFWRTHPTHEQRIEAIEKLEITEERLPEIIETKPNQRPQHPFEVSSGILGFGS